MTTPHTVKTIVEAIESSISSGELPVGHRMPTVAALAEQYGVNKNTVSRAMQKLKDTGFLEGPRGGYTQVSAVPLRQRALEEALRPATRARYSELVERLAVSSLPPDALDAICADLNAETLPPVSPLVSMLLNTAEEPDLLALYLRTHAAPEA